MTKPPCPICSTDERLNDWLLEVFNDPRFDPIDKRNISDLDKANRATAEAMSSDEAAIAKAEQGNIMFLRLRYPHFAKFLHLPSDLKVKPDDNLFQFKGYSDSSTSVAIDLAPIAKERWKEHRKDKELEHRKLSSDDVVIMLAKLMKADEATVLSRVSNCSYFSRK